MTFVKKPSLKANWKVVWWVYKGGHLKRYVIGRAQADQAWRLFWGCRGRTHIAKGPELWRGNVLVLNTTVDNKPSL